MLISYPILPANASDQTESQRFDAMLALAQNNRGLYPVTTGNRWHGGIHLSPGTEPIRAIADGTVVAYRLAADTKDYPGQGTYDTSFVLLRHETESGENTRIVFYSLYMHLRSKGLLNNAQRQQLAPFLRDSDIGDAAVQAPAKTRIWRKQVLGFAGQLYGVPTVHVEIFATDADFNTFWRDRSAIATGSHGSDDVFGDIHLIIPASRAFAERHPRAVAPHRIALPGNNVFYGPAPVGTTGEAANDRLPVGAAGQNADRLHVRVHLSSGKRTATSFNLDSQDRITGQIGLPVVQNDYEYELFRLATALYPDCPSAGFESLRFGRILGPDITTRTENWQLIRYSDTALGYINLADPAHQVSVLSDADFPILWQRLEEDEAASPADGMAHVARLTELLDLSEEPTPPSLAAPADFAGRAGDANVAALLRNFICRHPSEWDATDLEARYAALRQPGKPLHGDAPWQAFKEHVEAMAFWPQTGLAERSVWYFHPLQFVRHYRRCQWLSNSEMTQLFPRMALRNAGSARGWVDEAVTPEQANIRPSRVELNKAARKYLITTPGRIAAFYGNAMQETQWFALLAESRTNPAQRYAPWLGRGFLQLTWPDNYIKYWRFRGRTINDTLAGQLSAAARQANQDRTNVALEALEARLPAEMAGWRRNVGNSGAREPADSAGAYWSWSMAAQSADRNDPFVRETVLVGTQRLPYYTHAGFGRVAATVNVGRPSVNYATIHGVQARFQAYTSAMMVLGDSLQFPDATGQFQETPDGWHRRVP